MRQIETNCLFLKTPLGLFLLALTILLTLFFVSRYQLKIHNNKRYELRDYFLYISFVQAFSIYLILNAVGGWETFVNYLNFILVALIIYIGQQIGNYRKLEAEAVKDGKSNYKIAFKYHGSEVIQTNNNIIYIGQTQSTLFLYKRTDSSTLVFGKEHIDSLVIK